MPETTQSDLVERLTVPHPSLATQSFLMHEAAAEITRLRADSERLRKIESQIDGGRFEEWPTATFVGQLRMQSRDNLDPEYSQFMAATATHLGILSGQCDAQREIAERAKEVAARLRAHCEAMSKALDAAHNLLECIQQRSADNMWWVNADDPETACGDAYHEVDKALTAYRAACPEEG